MKRALIAALGLSLLTTAALAAPPVGISDPVSGRQAGVDPTGALHTGDLSNVSYAAIVNMADGATVAAARAWQAECSAAGNVRVTFSNGSTRTIPLAVGLSILPYAITSWTVSGVAGPATCTAANLP
jgi:hypothetical protein